MQKSHSFQFPFKWERAVVIELSGFHEHICRTHHVQLRPITVSLFDSDTLWGQFNNQTRTISISRKLVNEHSWDQVVGVFRHEMAHQYVAENHPQDFLSEKPHGERFREACQRLGVPAQFAKASVDLQSEILDWRSEPRDEATEKILDKVKKLLALGASANENEAHLAMERVRQLYAKHNLENMKSLSQEDFVHQVITHGKKRFEPWELRTIHILAEHFFVKPLLFKQFDAKIGERVQAFELVGSRENVAMAEYVYHFLLQQMETLLKQAAAREPMRTRAARKSFRLGVIEGFDKKLKLSNELSASSAPAADNKEFTVIGQALIQFHKDLRLDNYLSEIYPRLGRRRRSSVTIETGAFAAGQAVGESITLNKPISSHGGSGGQLLAPPRR